MAGMFILTGHLQMHKKMKTLICTKPGHLDYSEKEKPVRQPGWSIVSIRRIGICGTDLHAFDGTQPYFQYPRILGHELAAEVVETDAEGFKPGDLITIVPYFHCGNCIACRNGKMNCCENMNVCGVHVDGGMAEYLSVPSSSLLHSDGLNLDELALVEPLAIGAHAVRRAGISDNEFVLVIGAGPVGLGTMEFCRITGARVIAMDVNEFRLGFCRENLKIPLIIDGSSPDVEERLREMTHGDMPTTVIDATGNLKAINNAFSYLAHGGKYVLVGLQKEKITFSHPEFHKKEATLMSSRNATHEDFRQVINCIKRGKVDPAHYITHRSPFGEIADHFDEWLKPENKVIKAMVELN